jgi:tetratricopeptide (TPR) repeat protein
MSAATATGNLEATPLSQLLVYSLDKGLTGSFIFQTPDRKKSALYVVGGAPAKAKTAEAVIHLGRLLVEQGRIDDDTYHSTLKRVAKERLLHGQLLVQAGVLDQATLDAALVEQLTRQVVWLFALPAKTGYAYYAGKNYLEKWGGGPVGLEPLAVIWKGIRRYENVQRVDAALARLGNRVLKLHHSSQIARFQLGQSERAVVDVMRARPQPLTELLQMKVGEPIEVKRLLYTLMITRHLDVGAPPLGVGASGGASSAPRAAPPPPQAATAPPASTRAPPAPPLPSSPIASLIGSSPVSAPLPSSPVSAPPPSSAAPASEAPAVAEFRQELDRRAAEIHHQNYYEMLGVPVRSASAEISAAFFQLAKKWHPDRLGPEFGGVKDDAMRFFAKLTEAHQVLTDDERRRNYDELVKDGGGTEAEQEEVNKIMNAVVAFQKATVFFRKGNVAEAEALAKAAMEADPEQPEYTALWVQCAVTRPERVAKGNYRDLIELMDEAVKKDPENERVRMARGDVFKRAGQLDKAVLDFRYVARYFPNNTEAAREVRLFTMRGGEPPGKKKGGAEEKGGLFGKLFKR